MTFNPAKWPSHNRCTGIGTAVTEGSYKKLWLSCVGALSTRNVQRSIEIHDSDINESLERIRMEFQVEF